MSVFPRRENEVIDLAYTMMAGLDSHTEDFPNVDIVELKDAISEFEVANCSQLNLQSQAIQATTIKKRAYERMVDSMKSSIRQGQLDSLSHPLRITEIGWNLPAKRSALKEPGQPNNLDIRCAGSNTLCLSWDKPKRGGAVGYYIVQRRVMGHENSFDSWQLAGTSFDETITLNDQPRQTEIEFRIIATNPTGESLPSNTQAA